MNDLLDLAHRLYTDSDHGYLSAQEVDEYREASAFLAGRLLEIARDNMWPRT